MGWSMLDQIEQRRAGLLELCRKHDVRRLDIFGSAARGDFDPRRSDLDFLVEFNNFTIHNAADRHFDFLFGLQALLGRKADLLSDRAIRNPYLPKSVDSERINLYAA
jgi:uncharacterized protein